MNKHSPKIAERVSYDDILRSHQRLERQVHQQKLIIKRLEEELGKYMRENVTSN